MEALYSQQQWMGIFFAPQPRQHLVLSVFWIFAVLINVQWYLIFVTLVYILLRNSVLDTGRWQWVRPPNPSPCWDLWREIIEACHTAQLASPKEQDQRPVPNQQFHKLEVSQEWRQNRGVRTVQRCPYPPLENSPRAHIGIMKNQLVGPHTVCSNILIGQRQGKTRIRRASSLSSHSWCHAGKNYIACFLSPPLGLYLTHTLTGVHNSLDTQLSTTALELIHVHHWKAS